VPNDRWNCGRGAVVEQTPLGERAYGK